MLTPNAKIILSVIIGIVIGGILVYVYKTYMEKYAEVVYDNEAPREVAADEYARTGVRDSSYGLEDLDEFAVNRDYTQSGGDCSDFDPKSFINAKRSIQGTSPTDNPSIYGSVSVDLISSGDIVVAPLDDTQLSEKNALARGSYFGTDCQKDLLIKYCNTTSDPNKCYQKIVYQTNPHNKGL